MVRGQPSKPLDAKASEEHIVFILLNCAVNGRVDTRDKSGGAIQTIQPAGDGPGEPMVVPVLLSCIESFSVVRMHIGRDLKSLPARQEAYSRVKLLMSQRNGRVPVLDPIANMGIKDEGFLKLVKVREVLLMLLPHTPSNALYDIYSESAPTKANCKLYLFLHLLTWIDYTMNTRTMLTSRRASGRRNERSLRSKTYYRWKN